MNYLVIYYSSLLCKLLSIRFEIKQSVIIEIKYRNTHGHWMTL